MVSSYHRIEHKTICQYLSKAVTYFDRFYPVYNSHKITGVSPWVNANAKTGNNWFQNLAIIGLNISEFHRVVDPKSKSEKRWGLSNRTFKVPKGYRSAIN